MQYVTMKKFAVEKTKSSLRASNFSNFSSIHVKRTKRNTTYVRSLLGAKIDLPSVLIGCEANELITMHS